MLYTFIMKPSPECSERLAAYSGESVATPAILAGIAHAVLGDMDGNREHFALVFCDVKLRPQGFKVMHSGGMSSSSVDIASAMQAALLSGHPRFACVHNHPSGNPEFSSDDIRLCKRLYEASRVVGLPMFDFLAFAPPASPGDPPEYMSASEQGIV